MTETTPSPVVRISKLQHSYGTTAVLRGVSAELYNGEVVAILGANGAGKTTLLKLVLGLLRLQQGEVQLLGSTPSALRHQPALSGQVGVMLQQASLPGQLTVSEQLRLFSAYHPAPLPMSEVTERFALTDLLDRRCASLSGGQRQSLLLALALLGKPRLLFLDEPTTGLDAQARQRFWQQVREARAEGLCVVLTTHYLEEADALADRILLLRDGQFIADASPSTLKASQQQRRICCHTRLPHPTLAGLPGVHRLRALNDSRWQLDSTDVENCLRQLLALDTTVSDLTVSAASLEQVFLELTQAESRQNQLTEVHAA